MMKMMQTSQTGDEDEGFDSWEDEEEDSELDEHDSGAALTKNIRRKRNTTRVTMRKRLTGIPRKKQNRIPKSIRILENTRIPKKNLKTMRKKVLPIKNSRLN